MDSLPKVWTVHRQATIVHPGHAWRVTIDHEAVGNAPAKVWRVNTEVREGIHGPWKGTGAHIFRGADAMSEARVTWRETLTELA